MKCACVVVTGASGFVGSRLVQALSRQGEVEIRALIRRGEPPQVENNQRLTVVRGDVSDAAALGQLLRPGCTVANFAYDSNAAADSNRAAAGALADACAKQGVARLVHCSTAVVVGSASVTRIDETTACQPITSYEKTKLAIEGVLRDRAQGQFEFATMRPTAVFGPGGRNLLKMAHDLRAHSRFTNYLRACLNGGRRLHLIDVDNVVAAAAFLIQTQQPVDREVFIVADDEAPENNFRQVEQTLMRAFSMPDYPVPRVAVPASLLSLMLRLRGRSMHVPDTVFVSDKLKAFGFTKPVPFMAGLAKFAEWYRARHFGSA